MISMPLYNPTKNVFLRPLRDNVKLCGQNFKHFPAIEILYKVLGRNMIRCKLIQLKLCERTHTTGNGDFV